VPATSAGRDGRPNARPAASIRRRDGRPRAASRGYTQAPRPDSCALPYDALIFDCDGTLVDSERLLNQLLVDPVRPFGIELTVEEALARFKGGNMAEARGARFVFEPVRARA
jgi:hypothetical protein